MILFVIISLFFILILMVVIMSIRRDRCCDDYCCDDDIEEVIETIETECDDCNIKIYGKLVRQTENNQQFVIDPVDKSKVFINSKDDMYEDSIGNIWKLI